MSSKVKVGRWLIYGLLDPRGRTLFYVGKTHKRRELRLDEHIERALSGSKTPVHQRVHEILEDGYRPEIFVLKRVPPDGSWQVEERAQIHFWRNVEGLCLPVCHPPQTRKSEHVQIMSVDLLNVRDGG